jgi:hypothetical protein
MATLMYHREYARVHPCAAEDSELSRLLAQGWVRTQEELDMPPAASSSAVVDDFDEKISLMIAKEEREEKKRSHHSRRRVGGATP